MHFILLILFVGKDITADAIVCGIETRFPTDDNSLSLFRTYGTIDCGAELLSKAWSKLEHRFAIRWYGDDAPSGPHVALGPHRIHQTLLQRYPVDILVVNFPQAPGRLWYLECLLRIGQNLCLNLGLRRLSYGLKARLRKRVSLGGRNLASPVGVDSSRPLNMVELLFTIVWWLYVVPITTSLLGLGPFTNLVPRWFVPWETF